jgi:hypothetical protein
MATLPLLKSAVQAAALLVVGLAATVVSSSATTLIAGFLQASNTIVKTLSTAR